MNNYSWSTSKFAKVHEKLLGAGDIVYWLTNILFLWDFVEGLRTKEELAGRLSIGISIGELNRRMADEFGMKVEEIKRRGKI